MALVVDVIAHLDVIRIQIRSHLQCYRGGICSGEVMVSGGVQEAYASMLLTVDHQSPFVLDAALRHKWILCPARQVLAIVFAGHSDRENTQGLIPGLGEMLCHSLDLPCAQPPGHQSFGSGSGTFALNVV